MQIDKTGIKIDQNVALRHQVNNAAVKLNRATTMLPTIRHFRDFKTLKSIYHAISESRFNITLCQFWAQNANSV